jgi:hypothetical protein
VLVPSTAFPPSSCSHPRGTPSNGFVLSPPPAAAWIASPLLFAIAKPRLPLKARSSHPDSPLPRVIVAESLHPRAPLWVPSYTQLPPRVSICQPCSVLSASGGLELLLYLFATQDETTGRHCMLNQARYRPERDGYNHNNGEQDKSSANLEIASLLDERS